MIKINEKIKIYCNIEEAKKFINDMEKNYLIWSPEHFVFKNLKGTPDIEGSVFEQYEYFDGKKIGGRYKVAKVIENKYYEWRACFPRSLVGGKFIIAINEFDKEIEIEETICIGFNIPILGSLFDSLVLKPLARNNIITKLKTHQIEWLNTMKEIFEN